MSFSLSVYLPLSLSLFVLSLSISAFLSLCGFSAKFITQRRCVFMSVYNKKSCVCMHFDDTKTFFWDWFQNQYRLSTCLGQGKRKTGRRKRRRRRERRRKEREREFLSALSCAVLNRFKKKIQEVACQTKPSSEQPNKFDSKNDSILKNATAQKDFALPTRRRSRRREAQLSEANRTEPEARRSWAKRSCAGGDGVDEVDEVSAADWSAQPTESTKSAQLIDRRSRPADGVDDVDGAGKSTQLSCLQSQL